jgi:hypothetical protein
VYYLVLTDGVDEKACLRAAMGSTSFLAIAISSGRAVNDLSKSFLRITCPCTSPVSMQMTGMRGPHKFRTIEHIVRNAQVILPRNFDHS